MLDFFNRPQVYNKCGQTLAIGAVILRVVKKTLGADGTVVPDGYSVYSNTATIADGAYAVLTPSTTYSDTLSKNRAPEISGTVAVTAPASAAGTVDVKLQLSADGATWPDNGEGRSLYSYTFAAPGTVRKQFRIS